MGKSDEIKSILDFLRDTVISAWKGHEDFAVWLVKELKPSVIVDLGTEYGFSTFSFAAPKIGTVYGIDWFKGDFFTRTKNSKEVFMDLLWEMERKFGINNVEVIEGKFSDIAKIWKLPIDILHIDGSHRYKDIKEDFNSWSKFVKKDGVILLHDVNVPDKRFGVEKFYNELPPPKIRFMHSFGLGVVSKDVKLLKKIISKCNKVEYV